MGNQILPAQTPKAGFQFRALDEAVVLGLEIWGPHRTFATKGKPVLHAAHATPLRKVQKEDEVQDTWHTILRFIALGPNLTWR